MGGGFFGGFFGRAAAAADEFIQKVNDGFVFAGVVIAGDVGGFVAQGLVAVKALDFFLEAALGIFAHTGGGEAFREGSVEGEHNATGGGVSTVQIHRADEGLEGVFEGGVAGAAAGLFFTEAEAEVGGEIDLAGELGEETAAGEHGAPLGKSSFPLGGVEEEEGFGDNELEHGVAKELETLVVLDERGLPGKERRVGEGALKQGSVGKSVAEAGTKGGERGAGHQEEALL